MGVSLPELLKKASPEARPKIIAAFKAKKVRESERAQAVEIKSSIVTCRSCALNRTRTRAVPYSGPTHGRADIAVVGEVPGFYEDRTGKPFVGKSGKMLDYALTMAGTSREKVFTAYSIACRPPENRDPEASELEACRPNFDAQLNLAGTFVGVALGGYAIAAVMGVGRNEVKVKKYLDKPFWSDGRIWVGSYHPAFVARNPDAFTDTLVNAIVLALAIRKGSTMFPRPSKWVDVVRLGSADAAGLEAKMKKQGWVLVESKVLRSQIVVVDEYANAKIPRQLDSIPRYTLEELTRIGEAGAKREHGWSADDLRRLHYIKVEMGGEVVYG